MDLHSLLRAKPYLSFPHRTPPNLPPDPKRQEVGDTGQDVSRPRLPLCAGLACGRSLRVVSCCRARWSEGFDAESMAVVVRVGLCVYAGEGRGRRKVPVFVRVCACVRFVPR